MAPTVRSWRAVAAWAVGLALLAAVAGCGASTAKASGPTTTLKPSYRAPVTTVDAVPPDAASYAGDACRAFVAFAAYIGGVGEDGPDAAGEVQGMVVDADQAVTAGHGAPRWTRLERALARLEAYASSRSWSDRPSAARQPQFAAVRADCKPFR